MKKIISIIIAIFFIAYTVLVNAERSLTAIRDKRMAQEALKSALKESYGEDSYPDYYGGMYISDDSKNLIIQIVKDYIPQEIQEFSIYQKLITLAETIQIEYVNNSFNYLIELNNTISKIFENLKYDNHSSNYIDVMDNNVMVELIKNDKEHQNIITKNVENSYEKAKKIIKNKDFAITFKQSEYNTNGH